MSNPSQPEFAVPTTSRSSRSSPDKQSSTATGSRKRSRFDEGDSDSFRSTGSDFPPYVRNDVIRRCRQRCWYCEAPCDRPEVCHIVPRISSEVNYYNRYGLYSISSLRCFENAIGLCPLCHQAFDDISSPRLAILPDDLLYFIEYAERANESGQARDGQYIKRCPDWKEYAQHCIEQDQMTEADLNNGGLYHRYLLRDFLAPDSSGPRDWAPGRWLSGDLRFPAKAWWGDPMAMLAKAFHTLGKPVVLIPEPQRSQLRRLQDAFSAATPARTEQQPLPPHQPANSESIDASRSTAASYPVTRPSLTPHLPSQARQQPASLDRRHSANAAGQEADARDSAIDVNSASRKIVVSPVSTPAKANRKRGRDELDADNFDNEDDFRRTRLRWWLESCASSSAPP